MAHNGSSPLCSPTQSHLNLRRTQRTPLAHPAPCPPAYATTCSMQQHTQRVTRTTLLLPQAALSLMVYKYRGRTGPAWSMSDARRRQCLPAHELPRQTRMLALEQTLVPMPTALVSPHHALNCVLAIARQALFCNALHSHPRAAQWNNWVVSLPTHIFKVLLSGVQYPWLNTSHTPCQNPQHRTSSRPRLL